MALDHRSIIAQESARFRQLVDAGPADARVPGCPEWDLADLGWHLADVQRWAANVVTTGQPAEPPAPNPAPATPAEALVQATEALLSALDAADPEAPGWNFSSGPQTKAFWFRRQALEVAVHRWDAESAVSDDPAPLDTAVAADLIDEYLKITLQRVIDRERIDLAPMAALDGSDVHVHCTDTGGLGVAGEWTFDVDRASLGAPGDNGDRGPGRLEVVDEHRKAAVALRGPAADLALFLYNRVGADRVEVFGDPLVLAAWGPVLRF